ncbi:MAG: hypothetical protein WBC93_10820 [Sulfitobacter sp.]
MNMRWRIAPIIGRLSGVALICVVAAVLLTNGPFKAQTAQISTGLAEKSQPVVRPLPLETPAPEVDTVTRASPAPILQITPRVPVSNIPTSQQLRTPIRVFNTVDPVNDLSVLARDVLMSFGYTPMPDDPFQALLVQALSEWQSDRYIDAMLNAARIRGDFKVPDALITMSGQLDTSALLAAVVLRSKSNATQMPRQIQQPIAHTLQPSDSLAGLSLRYYGLPLEYIRITDANTQLAGNIAVGKPGQTVTIPIF